MLLAVLWLNRKSNQLVIERRGFDSPLSLSNLNLFIPIRVALAFMIVKRTKTISP